MRTLLCAAALLALAAATTGGQAPGIAGDGTLYVGIFPNQIVVVDEAQERVTEVIALENIPRRMVMSHDRRRFYVLNASHETMEIVDIASRRVVDTLEFSEGNRHVRVFAYYPDPSDSYLVLLTRTATRLPDRFEIESARLVQYDLASRTIVRTIPWPNGEERESADIVMSPDGSWLYLFADDVLVYETETFTHVDTWELSRQEDGLGRFSLGSTDRINDEPGFFTGLFTVQDPVQNRRLMGVARVNLQEREVDFYTLGPAAPVNFTLAPDRRRAYGLFREIGRYEFWTFDLERRRIHSRAEFAGRPRMALKTSSNGRVLYIYQAGETIDLYDAETYRYLRTISLTGDMTTDLFVLPGPAAPTSAGAPAR